MRRILIPWLAASSFAFAALADVPSYDVVKDKSTLKFYAIQNNAPVEGRFDSFTADIRFDKDKLEESKIAVEVDTGSVAAADADVTGNLKTADWLAVQAFPKAVFTSTKLTRMPQSENYYAEGKLTLRDKTVPVVLNFQLEPVGDKGVIAKGFVTLHRTDFGVGQGAWAKDDVVKDEVRVEFRIVAEKK